MKSAHDYIMETSFPHSEMSDIENAFNAGSKEGVRSEWARHKILRDVCAHLLNQGSGADQTFLIKALADLDPPEKKTVWVNRFYSDYHRDGHYTGTNGGPKNDGIFDTLEDARQYVIDNKVSNCTGQKEIPCTLLEDNTR